MGMYKNREDYLNQLCINHATVQHTVGGRKSFFKISNEEDLLSGTINDIDYPCVANVALRGRIKDKNGDATILNHVFDNEWIFLQHVPTTDETAINLSDEIQDAYDETFSIMEDFIKAMKDDYEANDRCGAFDFIDFSQMSYVQVGPYMNNEYGWRLNFVNENKATRIN